MLIIYNALLFCQVVKGSSRNVGYRQCFKIQICSQSNEHHGLAIRFFQIFYQGGPDTAALTVDDTDSFAHSKIFLFPAKKNHEAFHSFSNDGHRGFFR